MEATSPRLGKHYDNGDLSSHPTSERLSCADRRVARDSFITLPVQPPPPPEVWPRSESMALHACISIIYR